MQFKKKRKKKWFVDKINCLFFVISFIYMLDTSSLGTDIVTVLFVPVLLINIFFLDGFNRHLMTYGYF